MRLVGRGKTVRIGDEEHFLSIRRIGRRLLMILCSNQCGEILLKVQRMQRGLDPSSPQWRELEALAAQAREADGILNGVNRQSAPEAIEAADRALNNLRDAMQRIQGAIDPDIPVPSPTGQPTEPAATPTGRRVNLADHLPANAERVGEQVTIDLSSANWEVPPALRNAQTEGATAAGERVEYLYVVRDNITGEILKVGSTADIASRAGDYRNAAVEHAMNRQVSMEVQAVRLQEGQKIASSIETPVRRSVVKSITAERGDGETLPDTPVLPWDGTGSRLGGGPGIPGVTNRAMRTGEQYWWRERVWLPTDGPAPQGTARPTPFTMEELGSLLREHNGNVTRAMEAAGLTRDAFYKRLLYYGVTKEQVMALPEPGQ
jgi:hypothetical protein